MPTCNCEWGIWCSSGIGLHKSHYFAYETHFNGGYINDGCTQIIQVNNSINIDNISLKKYILYHSTPGSVIFVVHLLAQYDVT